MWKVAFVTLLFFGLGVGPSLAGDAHDAADRYLQSDAKVSDRDVALAILCLAAGLPEQSAQMGPGDREAVTKIQRLAGKIIGNGSPVAAAPPPKLAAAVVVVTPREKPAPKQGNIQLGTAILCEAESMMRTTKTDHAATKPTGACQNAAGSRDQLIDLAYKIIGNG
jgi:hypothetical protein